MIKLFQWQETDHLAFSFVPLELKGTGITWLLFKVRRFWTHLWLWLTISGPQEEPSAAGMNLVSHFLPTRWHHRALQMSCMTHITQTCWYECIKEPVILTEVWAIFILNKLRIITHYAMDRCSSQAVWVQKAVVQNNDTLFTVSGYNNDLSGLF